MPLQKPGEHRTPIESTRPYNYRYISPQDPSRTEENIELSEVIETPPPDRPQHENKMGNSNRQLLVCLSVVIAIIAVLVVILVPLSFVPLEYYEYGFARRKTTGSVYTDKVYGGGGRHILGPDYDFKIFPADSHFESFKGINVFAADRLKVQISCYLQYFIRKDQLQLLHKNYDLYYRPVLYNNAMDAIKVAATAFTTREYIRDRDRVEVALFKAVKERLGGTCCEVDCGRKGNPPCSRGCKPTRLCEESDYGLFVEVRYFQLTTLAIPRELNNRYVQALVLQEEIHTEKLRQQAQVIRKETQAQTQAIQNTATEIRHNATATSNLIAARAEASARATVEKARSDGLKHLYAELSITNNEQKASFDYLRTLRSQSNVKLTVDYQQMIAGNLK